MNSLSPAPTTLFVATLLLSLLFAQAMTSIPRLSVTFDEDLHISTGYGTLHTGDLRLVEDHPPLIGYLMSWPLLLSPDMPEPSKVPAWEDGDRRLFVRNDIWWSRPLDTWVIPPRIPIALLTVLLGAFLFRWAADWFGPRAGLLALAPFIFDPNILAHGALATLDLGVACFIFIAMFGLWRFLRHPCHKNLIIAGAFLGLAMGAKVSGVISLPITVGLIVLRELRRWRSERKTEHSLKRLIRSLSLYLGAAFLVLWAIHLFDFGSPPGLSIALPAPTYWNAFLRVGRHVSRGNPAYLLGETYVGGRWYYFPVVFALKTPLPAIILIGAGMGTFLLSAWRNPNERWRGFILMSMPVGYFLMSMVNQINLGYRHILPIVPFLYLFIPCVLYLRPYVLRTSTHTSRFTRCILHATFYALLLWQAAGTLRVWPFHLTYFNEIAGGPENGYRYLADSNVDWGQGLKALRDYLEEQSWPDIKLSSFTFFIRPDLYDIQQATPLPPLADAPAVLPNYFNPAPGTYVISASTLRGLQLIDREMYNWFWHREPDDIVANAMLVYRVTEGEPHSWLAQCTVPTTPIPREAVATRFGHIDLRLLTFDCTQSWLYPDGGKSSGWYVLHRETASLRKHFTQRRVDPARLSFEQKIPGALPPLTIYEWDPLAIVPSHTEGWSAPAECPPAQVDVEGTPISVPTSLDGPLTFLGYEYGLDEDTHTIALDTYWQVINTTHRSFSLIGHLLDADGHPTAVADGLGVPWDQLAPGDLLVQHHTFSFPQGLPSGPQWLQTGAYWLDTMERWPVRVEKRVVGDRIVLTQIIGDW